MNPHMAEDITILEQYLTHKPTEAQLRAKTYSTMTTTSGNPIVYLTVPRRRKGLLEPSADPGVAQKEIIEQVLSPFAAEVRKLYFDSLHPCFPILDEESFQELWHKDKECISSALLCDIYASALPFWRTSDALRRHSKPDPNFIWNNAVKALQDDFLGPTISTVHAALLDMVGRPVGAVTGNIVNTGRVVTLAQSLGLHRDPTSWKATVHEKNARIRLWWGVVIHDHWSSISHGIPPTIHPKYYDVPLVALDMLGTSTKSEGYLKAASTFIHLCKLTQILGDVLSLVYVLRSNTDGMWRSIRKAECGLDDWLVALPAHLALGRSPATTIVNGSSNLWFSYLSVKLLMRRLAFKATLKETGHALEARRYRLSTLRETSLEVIGFVTSLVDVQLQEFWLPYTSYLLVTAATILLRCTVECGDSATKRSCIAKLVNFRDRLSRASEESDWDLAEFCLERCGEPIQKFADALRNSSQEVQTRASDAEPTNTPTAVSSQHTDAFSSIEDSINLSELFSSTDSLQCPWEPLWDTLDGSWPT